MPVTALDRRLGIAQFEVLADVAFSTLISERGMEGSYESYAAFSVNPGNADGVITVGATHRYSPHTYGVSFFSSRGPTGDGRLKPDLVATGERISPAYKAS